MKGGKGFRLSGYSYKNKEEGAIIHRVTLKDIFIVNLFRISG